MRVTTVQGMTIDTPAYARLVADAMERQGLTRYMLAKLTGLSDNTVKNTMLGKHRPSAPNLTKMAIALGLDPAHALRTAEYPEALIAEMVEQSAPSHIDVADLSDQSRNIVQRIADALRFQEKHSK